MGLPNDEEFVCALDKNLQGKIHIISDFLCFYSSVLGLKSLCNRAVSQLKDISRLTSVTAFFIQNAIIATMKDRCTFMFPSFLNRENASNKIEKAII